MLLELKLSTISTKQGSEAGTRAMAVTLKRGLGNPAENCCLLLVKSQYGKEAKLKWRNTVRSSLCVNLSLHITTEAC